VKVPVWKITPGDRKPEVAVSGCIMRQRGYICMMQNILLADYSTVQFSKRRPKLEVAFFGYLQLLAMRFLDLSILQRFHKSNKLKCAIF